MTWTASATGGAPPLLYQFWLFDPLAGWSVLKDYDTRNTVTWTATRAGQYALQVWVRSAGSTAVYDTYAASNFFTVYTDAPSSVTLSANGIPPFTANGSAIWTAAASGATCPLEYEFWLFDELRGWAIVQAYGPNRTWTWTPVYAGNYAVQAWARCLGSSSPYEAWTSSGFIQVVQQLQE
jgi:hypothetical protein